MYCMSACVRAAILGDQQEFADISNSRVSSDYMYNQWDYIKPGSCVRTTIMLIATCVHGRPQEFFQGWAMRGSERRKSLSGVQGQLPGGGLGTKPPEADDNFSKWCINTSSTEALDNMCSTKPLYNISRGDKCPPLTTSTTGCSFNGPRWSQSLQKVLHTTLAPLLVWKFLN